MLERLINGRYAVDVSKPLPGAGGGMPAFAASDKEGVHAGVMAVQVQAGEAPRAQAIAALATDPPHGVLLPLSQGALLGMDGAERYFLICQVPPGAALIPSGTRLTETELLATVLQPAAAALEALRVRKVTHRAVRPGNLFHSGPAGLAVLGCAWAGPAARLQPAVFEPPYIAACHPSGRGEGLIADDVYALGVTLLSLALGRVPLAGLDEEEVLLRKLDHGSFDALAGRERLSPMFADLLRGMLAEHPEHRSPPASLTSAAAAGARRVATRPARRSSRPLVGLGTPVSSARTLAFAIARQPKRGVELIRSGEIDRWLRRDIGEVMLANRVQDLQRSAGSAAVEEMQRTDAVLAMRAVAVLDPLAPLCWRGLMLWPDGMGAVLAGAGGPEHPAAVEEIVAQDVVASWEAVRPRRSGTAAHFDVMSLRGWLQSGGVAGGAARLLYALAPGTRCRSELLSKHWVTQGGELLAALDALGPETSAKGPIDAHVAAFVAALAQRDGDRELLRLVDSVRPTLAPLLQLRVLARLQTRLGVGALPGIAGWLARSGELKAQDWRHRGRLRSMEATLASLIEEGRLAAILAAIDNPVERARDTRDAQLAGMTLRRIDGEISTLRLQASGHDDRAYRVGHEIAATIGIVAAGAAALAAGML